MRKKTQLFSGASLMTLLALTGCATKGAAKGPDGAKADKTLMTPQVLAEQDRTQMRETARARGEIMLKAVQTKDYAGFTRYFPDKIKQQFPKKAFDQFDAYIGKLEKWEYLTELTNPVMTTYLWKVAVTRKDAKGAPIRIDMLFQLSMMKENGKYQIVGSLFR